MSNYRSVVLVLPQQREGEEGREEREEGREGRVNGMEGRQMTIDGGGGTLSVTYNVWSFFHFLRLLERGCSC